MAKNKFYLTTSIVYINASPHIGFSQELLAADVVARFHRLKKDETFFLTGVDEHGSKIAKKAEEKGLEPLIYANKITKEYLDLTKTLNLSNDNFIRTTDKINHWPKVKEIWQKIEQNGDLYKRKYQGFYCVGCEAFLQARDLENGKCSIHKKEPEMIEEENWFFALSKYTDKIKELIEKNVLSIKPDSRRNETLAFLEKGLEDISFSRSKEKLSWGIPVPGDDSQVIYVWADALTNYISGAPEKFWPADLHIIGKDIARFHTIIWPAMLLSAKIELPKKIFVHGFISVDGEKMSKSLGNVISPGELLEKFGADGTRYILLKLLSFAEDGDFSWEKAVATYNSDLANELGNLVLRVLTLAKKVPLSPCHSDRTERAEESLSKVRDPSAIARDDISKSIEKLDFQGALELIWQPIKQANKKIDELKLWELVKNNPEKAKIELEKLLKTLLNTAKDLAPFLPETSIKIKEQVSELKIGKPLFPKIIE